MADSQTRIAGSGFTVLKYNGVTLAWAQTISDNAPSPVASPVAIQPLDAETPVEIALPRAIGAGTLRVTLFELWNGPVWQQLTAGPGGSFKNAYSILDLFKEQVKAGSVNCMKIIKRPDGSNLIYSYRNCIITDVDDSETINLNTVTMPKTLTIMYTKRVATVQGANS